MCDIKNGFKLCTCNNTTIADADWMLERIDASLPDMFRIGECAPVFSTIEKEKAILLILKDLNIRNCFDFDYSPMADDYLSIRINKKEGTFVYFRYKKNKWKEDSGYSFDSWKQKLEALNHGKINNA